MEVIYLESVARQAGKGAGEERGSGKKSKDGTSGGVPASAQCMGSSGV